MRNYEIQEININLALISFVGYVEIARVIVTVRRIQNNIRVRVFVYFRRLQLVWNQNAPTAIDLLFVVHGRLSLGNINIYLHMLFLIRLG